MFSLNSAHNHSKTRKQKVHIKRRRAEKSEKYSFGVPKDCIKQSEQVPSNIKVLDFQNLDNLFQKVSKMDSDNLRAKSARLFNNSVTLNNSKHSKSPRNSRVNYSSQRSIKSTLIRDSTYTETNCEKKPNLSSPFAQNHIKIFRQLNQDNLANFKNKILEDPNYLLEINSDFCKRNSNNSDTSFSLNLELNNPDKINKSDIDFHSQIKYTDSLKSLNLSETIEKAHKPLENFTTNENKSEQSKDDDLTPNNKSVRNLVKSPFYRYSTQKIDLQHKSTDTNESCHKHEYFSKLESKRINTGSIDNESQSQRQKSQQEIIPESLRRKESLTEIQKHEPKPIVYQKALKIDKNHNKELNQTIFTENNKLQIIDAENISSTYHYDIQLSKTITPKCKVRVAGITYPELVREAKKKEMEYYRSIPNPLITKFREGLCFESNYLKNTNNIDKKVHVKKNQLSKNKFTPNTGKKINEEINKIPKNLLIKSKFSFPLHIFLQVNSTLVNIIRISDLRKDILSFEEIKVTTWFAVAFYNLYLISSIFYAFLQKIRYKVNSKNSQKTTENRFVRSKSLIHEFPRIILNNIFILSFIECFGETVIYWTLLTTNTTNKFNYVSINLFQLNLVFQIIIILQENMEFYCGHVVIFNLFTQLYGTIQVIMNRCNEIKYDSGVKYHHQILIKYVYSWLAFILIFCISKKFTNKNVSTSTCKINANLQAKFNDVKPIINEGVICNSEIAKE